MQATKEVYEIADHYQSVTEISTTEAKPSIKKSSRLVHPGLNSAQMEKIDIQRSVDSIPDIVKGKPYQFASIPGFKREKIKAKLGASN